VLTGQVQYLDYESAAIPESNTMWPFVHKRMSFAHEQELRALIQDLPVEGNSIALGKTNTENGRLVPVDLETLVDSFYIAPSAPTWYPELIRSVLRRYGLSKSVNHSSLDADPVY
jgi:hypothetical protein